MTDLVTDVLVCQEEQRNTRLAICENCGKYTYDEQSMFGRCTLSDDKPVPLMATLLDEVCPLGKW